MPEKIIITIPRKKKPKPSGGGSLHRGPIRTERKSEYLSRRRTTKGINFYDLGSKKNESGQFETIPFSIVPFFDTDTVAHIRDIDVTDFAARDAYYTSVPTSEWTSKFRRISKGELSEHYGISAAFGGNAAQPLDELDEWTANGLILSDASDLELDTNFYLFESLLFSEIGKITSVYDVDAEAVSFTPSTQMDIFFCPTIIQPKLITSSSVAEETDGMGGSWISGAFSHINYIFIVTPRDILIDEDSEFFGIDFFAIYSNNEDVEDYTEAYQTLQWHMSLPDQRGYVQYVGTEGSESSEVWEVLTGPPVGPITVPPTTPPQSPPLPGDLSLTSGVVTYTETTNVLQAVIKQGSNWFYLWS